ncbi:MULTISPECIES: NAD(P)H-dependent oxidoreductase [unclassified Halomonas]|uniref:NAD(P)H-dependent oxidoreductase n=1 Tax=unclassified Halomonas TaxID=2609666 RepID=UPI001C98DAD6|nr:MULTISPECIES: NAD(P)H-dependent oxidoreductase [unclassified Halomonas]MBY5926940.1 NAD(P)H-dependent oxidoreductase [Halomonas sp. DP4Y7-2]MBY6233982.1 NAD(P)H-dependent oxidoreductase [Halomonas sp. DP4Y7-1]
MKCLVVVAHPVTKSLCHYLAKQTMRHLESKGYEITFLDLYESKFSPQLTERERSSYYTSRFDESLLYQEIAQLKAAEALVLVFPTWWFEFPAILKGWFDRVWAPGHAYNHAPNLGAITPCLTNLKEVRVVTTLGSAWWVDKVVLRQPVKRVLKVGLLGACAHRCSFRMLSLYRSEDTSFSRVESFVRKIESKF